MPERIPPPAVRDERHAREVEHDDWLAGEDDPWLENRAYTPGDWLATMRMFGVAIAIWVVFWAVAAALLYWLMA